MKQPSSLSEILNKTYIKLLTLGNSADIMKVGGYKLSALEIEATLLDVSSCSSNANCLLHISW